MSTAINFRLLLINCLVALKSNLTKITTSPQFYDLAYSKKMQKCYAVWRVWVSVFPTLI